MESRDIWTIGHWTCPEDVFLQPLVQAGIDVLADVRAQPGSRRSPQFGRDTMPTWLAEAGIEYVHLPDLTGRRPRQPEIPEETNAGWHNRSFHNYADYTLTPDFERGLTQLTELASTHRVAILCGEPMPWRCHRSLIATVLTAHGWTVWHLSTTAKPREHELGAWGATPHVAANGTVTYPTQNG